MEDIYPLTPMQKLMLLHTLSSPDSDVLIDQFRCTLCGSMNIPAFQAAWHRVVRRHTIFRTLFLWEGLHEPVQVVRQEATLPWEFYDLRGMPESDQETIVSRSQQERQNQGFILTQAPLMQVTLFQLSDHRFELIWTFHHLIADGWCHSLVLQEVFQSYGASARGVALDETPTVPYRSYIAWLQQRDHEEARAFWREYLAGFTEPTLAIPNSQIRMRNTAGFREYQTALTPEDTQQIGRSTRGHQVTLTCLLQAAWSLVLARHTQKNDIVSGSTVSGRPLDLPGVESMIGMLINNIPIRVRVDGDRPVGMWLREQQQKQLEMREYEYMPLGDILQCSTIKRGSPLFESLVVVENYPVGQLAQQQDAGFRIENIRDNLKTGYPITIVAIPGAELQFRVLYHEELFSVPDIRQLAEDLLTMLRTLAKGEAETVGEAIACIPARTELLRFPFPATEPKALPAFRLSPSTDTERTIEAVLGEYLQLDAIACDEHFFDLGCTSLLLVEIHARLQKELSRTFPLVDMFTYPTIEALARHLTPASMAEKPSKVASASNRGQMQREAMNRQRQLMLKKK